MPTRYSFGGDEHLFAEIDEVMSLEAFFKSLALARAVRESNIKGVTEICPSNASMQVRFDPDQIAPDDLLAEVRSLEAAGEQAASELETRIIEIPVYYNDPWTHETLMRFRERHQDPSSTDLEYAAKIQWLCGCSGLCGRSFGVALVCLDGRICGRFAVPLSNGRAAAPDRSTKIPAPAYGYAEADCRPRRLFQLYLFGSRCWGLSAFWHHADADLRSKAGSQLPTRLHDFLPAG